MTITILPPAKTIFVDGNGVPLAGGSAGFYVPNTLTFKTTWQDSGAVTPNANPITLDGEGGALIWGTGTYREIIKDVNGNLIWDQITADLGAAILATFNGTSTTSVAVATGSQTFTTQPGLQFFPGGTVNIASAASALNYMNGTVTSYNTTTGVLVVNVLTDGGSGTHADWNIAVSGIQGPAGTVTSISIATANGFAGTSSGGGTPQLTLTTSVTGILLGNATAISAAVASTDYIAPNTGSALVNEAMFNLSNNSTANVSTSQHGLAPILPNDVTKFLNGLGNYTAPAFTATVGTSTTSNTVGTGALTFTTQTGLGLGVGEYLVIASTASPSNYIHGQVTSYSGSTLVFNGIDTGGSGTFAAWTISVSGPQGPSGGVASGTINQLAYYASSGSSVSGLATANSGILVTSGGGVPSISTAIPNGVTATTQSALDNSTKVATTAYTDAAVAAKSSGALILLATVNASAAASVAFSSTYITNTYNKYVIEFDGVTSSTGSRFLYFTLSTNNGSTYLSSAYTSAGIYMAVGSSTVSSFANPITSAIPIDGATNYILNTSAPSSGTIKFTNPSASQTFAAEFSMRSTGGSSINLSYGSGFNTGTTAINNVMLALSGSGTITGNFHLYGIAGV